MPVATDARGHAQVTVALGSNPSLRGLSLLAQWLLVAPGGCSAAGLSFSNAIGFDHVQYGYIPEPSTALLVAAGLVVIAARRRPGL